MIKKFRARYKSKFTIKIEIKGKKKKFSLYPLKKILWHCWGLAPMFMGQNFQIFNNTCYEKLKSWDQGWM